MKYILDGISVTAKHCVIRWSVHGDAPVQTFEMEIDRDQAANLFHYVGQEVDLFMVPKPKQEEPK